MKSLLRFLALSTLLAFFAAPLAATHGELSATRSPGGPVVAGSIISVTVNIENTSQFGEDLFDATVNTAFTDPNLVLIPGSVTTRYVEIDNPSGTITSGNDPGDRDVFVELDPVPPNWTAQVQFRMRLASVVAAGVDEAFTQIFLTYCHNNCQSIPWYMIVPIVARPELEVNKNDFGASAAPGGVVQYNISVTNVGNQEATGLTLTDTIPGRTRFYAAASDPAWSCSPNGFSGSVCTITFDNLWPGDTEAFAFALQADSPPAPAGWNIFRNTARASDDGSNSGGTPRTALDNEYTPLVAQPDLSLAISDGGVAASPGDTVPYTLSYSNVGNQDATGVLLETTVPSNTRFASTGSTPGWTCSPSAGGPGATCTLVVGELAVGATAAAAFSLTIDSSVPSGLTQVAHAVTVRDDGTNGADPNPSDNQAVETTPVAAAPDLTLTKGDGGATARPGDVVTYTLSVRNAGDQAADGVRLQETVPAHSTFDSASSAGGWSCSPSSGSAGATCTLAIGTLPAGGSASRAFAVRVASELFSGVEELSNTATVADDGANGADPTPGNNSASDTTPLVAAPDLTLTKDDGGATARPGELVTYTLTIRNTGDQSAGGVRLEETVPAHASHEPAPGAGGWTCTPSSGSAGATCTIPIGPMGAGASRSRSFAVRVDSDLPSGVDQLSNTATVTDNGSNGSDPTPGNNRATDATPVDAAPDLALTKDDGGATARPGEPLTYTLRYRNDGAQAARGVVLEETVPAYTTLSSAGSTSGWTCTPAAGGAGATCTLVLGELLAGASGTATFVVAADETFSASVDTLVNTATLTDDGSNGADTDLSNNRATASTPLDATPDLVLAKADGGATVSPGQRITYTLTYRNDGAQAATGVFLRETVPSHSTFDPAASAPDWTCTPGPDAGGTCTLLVGNLSPGDSGSAAFSLTVADSLPVGVDQISNTATVGDDGANGTEPTPDDNEATETTPIDAAPDLVLTKDDGGATAAAGQVLSYTLSYRNAGSQTASGVELEETVPEHTTFSSADSTSGWSCAPAVGGAGATCTLAVGDLAAGASGSVTFAVLVADELPASVEAIVNTAVVRDDGSNGADPDPDDNEDTTSTPVDAAPDLVLAKDDGGATAAAGQVVMYTLSYRNTGSQAASGVELEETVPEHTTFSSADSSPGWTCAPAAGGAGATCTLAVGGLAAGASESATFAVLVSEQLPAGIEAVVNTAVIRDDGSNGADPEPDDNEDTISTPVDAVPDLVLAKDDGGAAAVAGEAVTYTLTYRNAGSQEASGVELEETVPAHTTFSTSNSTSGWSCAPAAGGAGASCTLPVAAVAAGASGSATFTVLVSDELPAGVEAIVNTAVVRDDGANGPDPSPNDNEATDSTPLGARPDLTLAKDDGGATAVAGEVVTYTLTYRNAGSQEASGVELEETVPAHTTFSAAGSSPGWACLPPAGTAGAVCKLQAGDLAAGATKTATFAVTAAAELSSDVSQLVNTASVRDDGSQGPDPTPDDNDATDSTPVDPSGPGGGSPELDLYLTDLLTEDRDGSHTVSAGDVLTYSIDAVNDTESPALQPVLVLPIPDHTRYVADSARGVDFMTATTEGSSLRLVLPDLPAGERVGLALDVVLDVNLPDTVDEIRAQATLAAEGLAPHPSDDPDTVELDDPTITPLNTPGDPGGAVPIPTASEYGLLALALLLAGSAWRALQRRAPA